MGTLGGFAPPFGPPRPPPPRSLRSASPNPAMVRRRRGRTRSARGGQGGGSSRSPRRGRSRRAPHAAHCVSAQTPVWSDLVPGPIRSNVPLLMATRTLLCVEPDQAALQVLSATLAPYGFEITNITNGDEAVEWSRKNLPALIIVSVEPKKVGYAICNKLKRSAELKNIPLILTSSDEVPAKFEQHKTFKLRADEYIFKPFDADELCRKVDTLLGLGVPAASTSEEMLLSSDLLSSEIAIEADDIVDESHIPTPPPAASPAGGAVVEMEAEASDSSALGSGLDAIFDKEAQAAFDALEIHEQPTVSRPSPEQSDEKAEPWDEQAATSVVPSDLVSDLLAPASESDPSSGAGTVRMMPGMAPPLEPPEDVPQASSPEPQVDIPPGVLRESDAEAGPPPEPDAVNATSVETLALGDAPEGLLADLQERIHNLENDKRRLQSELEELNGRLQAQPF